MNKNQKIARSILRRNNINPSYYRIVILENMLKNRLRCLKANELYELIHSNAPTISKATLYNNLLIFENTGIVNKISFGQDDIRYCIEDGKFYIYFKCRVCKEMYKIEKNLFDLNGNDNIDGYKIEKIYVTAYGVCKKCL